MRIQNSWKIFCTLSCTLLCRPIVEGTGPLSIELRGIECMNDDPSQVRVLFAEISRNDKLQEMLDKIVDHFVELGK